MGKNVYDDPLMGNKYNMFKLRSDIAESQAEEGALRARDRAAAKEKAAEENEKNGLKYARRPGLFRGAVFVRIRDENLFATGGR